MVVRLLLRSCNQPSGFMSGVHRERPTPSEVAWPRWVAVARAPTTARAAGAARTRVPGRAASRAPAPVPTCADPRCRDTRHRKRGLLRDISLTIQPPQSCWPCPSTFRRVRFASGSGSRRFGPLLLHPRSRGSASAAGITCWKCGRQGHWAQYCPSAPANAPTPTAETRLADLERRLSGSGTRGRSRSRSRGPHVGAGERGHIVGSSSGELDVRYLQIHVEFRCTFVGLRCPRHLGPREGRGR